MNIIEGAYNKTGQQVAILIDEYDSPLQHSWRTPHHEACTNIYREVFAILKADDKYEKFVFITGITKFTQISLRDPKDTEKYIGSDEIWDCLLYTSS